MLREYCQPYESTEVGAVPWEMEIVLQVILAVLGIALACLTIWFLVGRP